MAQNYIMIVATTLLPEHLNGLSVSGFMII